MRFSISIQSEVRNTSTAERITIYPVAWIDRAFRVSDVG